MDMGGVVIQKHVAMVSSTEFSSHVHTHVFTSAPPFSSDLELVGPTAVQYCLLPTSMPGICCALTSRKGIGFVGLPFYLSVCPAHPHCTTRDQPKIMAELTQLLTACEHVVKLPSPVPEAESQAFFAAHPLEAVFQCVRYSPSLS